MIDRSSLHPTPRLSSRGVFFSGPRAWLLCALALCAALYWPGLSGPLLLDDEPNFKSLREWIDGTGSWQAVVLSNDSGPLGRSVAMATFLVNVEIGGTSVFALKLGNLLIHLLCGVAIFAMLRRVLAHDARLARRADAVAALVAIVWLIHPIQVSTVHYVIQRMAQLATLFAIASVWIFVLGREAARDGETRRATLLLFGAFPLALALATFSKENGVLAPVLCAVVELAYFPARGDRRPPVVRLFFGLFVWLPAVLGAVALALKPGAILEGYSLRDFTLGERLLTEPRVLADYVRALLLPGPRDLGLYTDGFAPSRGLLSPPSTIVALVALLATVAAAIRWRRAMPALFFGVGWYLGAQLLESTVFPLDLYFEHRNYLASVGLFVVLAAIVVRVFAALPTPTMRRVGAVALVLLFAVLAAATNARSLIWRDRAALFERSAAAHPESVRAHLDLATMAVERRAYDVAREQIRLVTAIGTVEARRIGSVYLVALRCALREPAGPADARALEALAGPPLSLAESQALELFAQYAAHGRCGGLGARDAAAVLLAWVDAAAQPDHLVVNWRVRYLAGTLLLEAGETAAGRAQIERAWASGAAGPAVGGSVVLQLIAEKDLARAREVLAQVRRRVRFYDRQGLEHVAGLEAAIAAAEGERSR